MAHLRTVLIVMLLATAVSCSQSLKEKRLKWNLKTTVGEYKEVGRCNKAWDATAIETLELFSEWRASEATAGPELAKKIAEQAETATKAGCKDPLVRYVHTRFVVARNRHTALELASAQRSVAEQLKDSSYSAMRRFYGHLRAAEAIFKLEPVRELELTEIMNDAYNCLAEAIKENDAPYGELHQAARACCYFSKQVQGKILLEDGWSKAEQALRKKWGNNFMQELSISEVAID